MNKFLTAIIFFIFNLTIYAQDTQYDQFDIVGEWTMTDDTNDSMDYIFSEDGYTSIRSHGRIVNGKSLKLTGGRFAGKTADNKYEITQTGEYVDLNLIYYMDNVETARIPGRLKIINKDECLIILDFKKEFKSIEFSEINKSKICTFKRIKK